MGHRAALIALAAVMVSAVLGCGGSRGTTPDGGHTYIFVPTPQSLLPTEGVYLTIISPAALPASVFRNGGMKRVAQVKGPQDCSYGKPIQGLPGKAAHLNGKTVTLKVNGSNPFTTSFCSAIKKDPGVPADRSYVAIAIGEAVISVALAVYLGSKYGPCYCG